MVNHPILEHLPDIIILRPRDFGGEPWITASLKLMALETDLAGQGMKGILSRLLEITFIQIVRRMKFKDEKKLGYMHALGDEGLSKALLAIHQTPEKKWTVDRLAVVSGMSRAGFAEKFALRVGMTPIGYLTNWRLIKALQMLRHTDLGMDEVAERCGYAALPSFLMRFKIAFNIGPGVFRKQG